MIRPAGRLAWRAFGRFLDHSGPDRAAAVAYYTLLSLLPLLILVVSLGIAVLGSFDAAYQQTLMLFGGVVVHMDRTSLEALRTFTEGATRFQWPGLVLLLWTARRAFASVCSALETVFEVPARSFAHGNLLALALVLVTGFGLLASLALATLVATVEGVLTGIPGAGTLHSLTAVFLTTLVPVLITFSFFFILYRVVPRDVVNMTQALAGALLATVLWETAKAAFAYYLRNWATFGGLYGALEGIIVLALWLEISASIVLYVGEVVALMAPPPL